MGKILNPHIEEEFISPHVIKCTRLHPPHVAIAGDNDDVNVNGDKGEQPLVPWGCVGRAVCQQHGWGGCAMHMAGATGTCWGTDSPQMWGMQREMCFHPENGSVVSCAAAVGKHHVEEQRGN